MGQCILVDDSGVAGVLLRGAVQCDELLRYLNGDTHLRLGRAGSQMGRGHDFRMIDERLGDLRLGWLLRVDVEGGASALATLQCIEHRLLVDDAATCHIDYFHALLALGQGLRRDEICGRRESLRRRLIAGQDRLIN